MPDVYRRAELARWHLLVNPLLAVASLVVLLAAGASIDFVSLATFVVVTPAATWFVLRRAAKWEEPEGHGVLASPAAARAKAIRVTLFLSVPLAAVIAAVSAITDEWWTIPGAYALTAALAAAEWHAVTTWERRHPGAYLVIGSGLWRPQHFALRPQG
jgi:hypothetical protein